MSGRNRLGTGLVALAALVWIAGPSWGQTTKLPDHEVWDEEILPTDPRMIEANSLLDSQAQWPRAIAIYEGLLAEDPENGPARRWLARVLSWRGDYSRSLAEYDLLAEFTPPAPQLAVERAEVLTWAGRYDEAEAAFQAMLEIDPQNSRAARGLAHVYLWSDRPVQAQRALERALELESDPDLANELAKLRAGNVPSSVQQQNRYLTDSDGFSMWRFGAEGAIPVGIAHRVTAEAGVTQLRGDHGESLLPGEPARDRALDLSIGLERHFGRTLRVHVAAGGRSWHHQSARALARGELEWTATETTAVGFEIDHSDFLERSQSLGAVVDGLSDTTGRAWLWQALGDKVTSYGYAETSFISDDNQRVAGGLDLSLSPWRVADVAFALYAQALHYSRDSDRYYAPSLDVEAGVRVRGAYHPASWIDLHLAVGGGVGHTREEGITGTGFSYALEQGLRLKYEGWWLDVVGEQSRSQRGSRYFAYGVGLSIGRGF